MDHLPGALPPETLLLILRDVVIFMATSLCLLMGVLVLQKLGVERRERLEETILAHLRRRMDALEPDRFGDDPRPWETVPPRVLARVLARQAHAPGNPLQDRETGPAPRLIERLEPELRHRHWGRRATAHEALSALRVPGLRGRLLRAARDEPDERVFAAQLRAAAALTRSAVDLDDLVSALRAGPSLSRTYVDAVLRVAFGQIAARQGDAATAQVVGALLENLNASDSLLADALGAASALHLPSAAERADRLLGDPDLPAPLRLTCLRTIGRLHDEHPRLIEAARDTDWKSRTVAASHLGGRSPASLAALIGLLQDRDFHVRRNAATSLAASGPDGIRAMRVIAELGDAYASDAAGNALLAREMRDA